MQNGYSSLTHRFKQYCIILFIVYLYPIDTFAVPPPDLIIQAVSQIWAFFTLTFALISGIFWTSKELLRWYYEKHRWYFIIFILLCIGSISWITASLLDNQSQQRQKEEQLRNWAENTKQWNPEIFWSWRENTPKVPYTLSGKVIEDTISKKTLDYTSLKLDISNKEVEEILETQKENILILDAREDLEYLIWNIPWSTHVRFADIKNGGWDLLPKDKHIIVACWSGMRGKEITLELRKHGLQAQYFENGVDGWVSSGGIWQGEIKFSHFYKNPNYSLTFSTQEFQKKNKKWVIIIDTRTKQSYDTSHFENSIQVSTIETPQSELESLYEKVGSGKTFIVVCDGYINCFDAKLTGITLEKRWNIFLWRYTTPWELLQ